LGKLDIVLLPVDGGRTLDLPTILKMLTRLQTKVVLPMNWSDAAALLRFLDGLSAGFAADFQSTSTTVISSQSLPDLPRAFVFLAAGQASGA